LPLPFRLEKTANTFPCMQLRFLTVLSDFDEGAHIAYRLSGLPALLLIRPDSHIALRCRPAAPSCSRHTARRCSPVRPFRNNDLVRKRRKPIMLIVDETHELRRDTLIGLKRPIQTRSPRWTCLPPGCARPYRSSST